jgi:hypothetical protein
MKPIHFSKALGACALAAVAAATVAPANAGLHAVPFKRIAAGARIVEFAVPGAAPRVTPHCFQPCGTQALAVSPSGAITGTYTDAYNVVRGFLRTQNGAIEKFDATSTRMETGDMTAGYSINAAGEIAGQLRKDGISHGLLRTPNGEIQIFDVPSSSVAAGQGTVAQSINAAGMIAGNFLESNGLTRGFVRTAAGAIATFKVPTSISTDVCAGACINASGKVTGTYTNVWGALHCYIRSATSGAERAFIMFDAPDSGFGPNQGTACSAINAAGAVVGTVVDEAGLSHGFVRSATGAITVFDVPVNGALLQPGTRAMSIDDRGVITGYYTDAHFVSHAYSRSANGTFRILEAPGAGASAGEGTFAAMDDSAGGIAGSFVDADGVSRGFWWSP